MIRRHGQPDGFWGVGTTQEVTGAGGASRAVQLGQAVSQFIVYLDVSDATVITIQAAHSGEPDVDGTGPQLPESSTYKNLYWKADPMTITFTGSGSRAVIVPDFTPGWVRLTSSNSVSCLAGWEVSAGD